MKLNVHPHFVGEIKSLIEESKRQVSQVVNSTITMLYLQVGKKINSEILKDKRAEYGKEIVATLSRQLTIDYGSGWSEKQLRHCLRSAETIPDEQIVSALRRQLTWSQLCLVLNHIRSVMHIRHFVSELCPLAPEGGIADACFLHCACFEPYKECKAYKAFGSFTYD